MINIFSIEILNQIILLWESEIKKKYLYLLDFGLSKKYRSSRTLQHYPMVKKKKLTGTARYASINALKGYEQSRRDDLEAVGYVLVYFLLGSLPWQCLPGKEKEDRYMKIMEKKQSTSPHELCKNLPIEFEQYIDYTRKMEYEQDPDYDYLTSLLMKGLKGEEIDYIYDWTDEKEKQERKESSLHLGPEKLEEEVEEVQKDKEEKVEVFEQGGNTPITVVNNYVNHVNNIVINNNNEKKEENKEMEEDNKVFSYLNEGVLKNDQLNQISNQRPTNTNIETIENKNNKPNNSKNVLKEENIKRGRKGNKNEYTIHQSKDTSDNKCCVIF